jgi:transposase
MEYYAGIDVSLESSSLCVVDATGRIVREAKVASEPEALIAWLQSLGFDLARIGLEAGPLSQWLYAGLKQAGLAAELLETRHVRNAFKIMPVKTDRKDARGIAQFWGIHLTGVGDLPPRAARRRLLQAGWMAAMPRRFGGNRLWAMAHDKVFVTNGSMRDGKLQDPVEQHSSAA